MEYLKNHTSASRINNESGVLLIEVIISVGIAGILMLSLLSMMQLVNQNSSRVSLGITKTEIITKIRNNAALLANVESSARMTQTLGVNGLTPDIGTANSLTNFNALADCLPSVVSSGSCNKTNMDDARGFRFYLSNGTSEDPTKSVAGEDVYFTLSGQRCSQTQAASAAECPIMSQAWAEPFCSNFSAICPKAISLTIRYKVSLRPDFLGTALMAPIEGEIYLPLTKGIQLSRLLSETDNPISMNSSGIYSVQKFYGQAGQPRGLRFEAVLGNPTGLTSMRLQVRALKGTAANAYLDNVIPNELTSITTWDEVPDPISGASQWVVNLSGAKANQIINFGTQTTATVNNNVNKFFKIGTVAGASDQATFFWTYNTATSQFVAPTFKSGFYQFRVVATDTNNNTIESMNYITVRIVPLPELKKVQDIPGYPSLTQTRVCISGQSSVNYNFAILDDEGIGAQTLNLSGSGTGPVSFSAVSGTGGIIAMPFDLSQAAGTFTYTFTGRNKFYGSTVNGYTIGDTTNNFQVVLSEVTLSSPAISVNPSIIKVTNSGNVVSRVTAGSCCDKDAADISATWRQFGGFLSNPASPTAVTCNLDTTNKVRTCEANVSVTGINETAAVAATNFESNFNFGTGNTACSGVKSFQTAIRVVRIPNIHFYLTESLWLTIPGNPLYSLKNSVPKVYVEIDFDPEESVGVEVYKTSDNQTVCTVTFPTGTKTYPTQIPCNIPVYSGKLALRRSTANVQHPGDAASPSYFAKINADSSKSEHTTCQANLTSLPSFPATMNVGTTHAMYNSPFGFDASNVQDPQNDFGIWNAGNTKTLRCYDNWRNDNTGSLYNQDTIKIGGTCGSQLQNSANGIFPSGQYPDLNQQDAYFMYKYQNASKPWNWYCPVPYANAIGSSSYSSSWSRFFTYVFPDSNAYFSTDFDPPNTPYSFVVWNNGAPGGAIWQYNGGTGAATITPPRTWTDQTLNLCNGSATLTKIKIFSTKASGHATAETVMKANNNMYSQAGSGFFNYFFMCSYGRWNPKNKTSTNWTN